MEETKLTRRPPRGPQTRLGGFSRPRCDDDKARATVAGSSVECRFNNPLGSLLLGLASQSRKSLHEAATWGAWTDSLVGNDVVPGEWPGERTAAIDARRTGMGSVFVSPESGDYFSFGGPS